MAPPAKGLMGMHQKVRGAAVSPSRDRLCPLRSSDWCSLPRAAAAKLDPRWHRRYSGYQADLIRVVSTLPPTTSGIQKTRTPSADVHTRGSLPPAAQPSRRSRLVPLPSSLHWWRCASRLPAWFSSDAAATATCRWAEDRGQHGLIARHAWPHAGAAVQLVLACMPS